jgi:signal transduction histidine kinase
MKKLIQRMTIRQRLTISNLLMLIIPVLISAMIFAVCMGLIWLWALRNTNSRFMDSGDFYSACEGYHREVISLLETEDEDDLLALDSLGTRLSWENISLMVLNNGVTVYSNDLEAEMDSQFRTAMEEVGGNGYISVDDHALYAFVTQGTGGEYQVFLSGKLVPPTFQKLRIMTGCAIAVLVVGVIVAAYLTNRFLIRFAFRRIQEPMSVLAQGVTEIGKGNLDYQIDYQLEDEFTPICDSFNQMSRQLKTSLATIQKQEENRKELLAGISHDLRSPLTNISAYANGLIDGVAQTEEAKKHYLYMIRDKADEMIRMVSRLVQFSKMDMGDYPVYPEHLDLNRELEELVEAMAPEYREKGLEITYEHQADGFLYADPDQLHCILVNIIDNSWKYKTAEMGHFQITLSKEGNQLKLSLRDDGPGVTEEALPKLFDVFYRSDPARKNPGKGSGLGLAIAANAVERMKGTMTARNCVPHGLELIITLPEDHDHG